MSFRGGSRGFSRGTGANASRGGSRGGRGGFQPSFGPPASVFEMGSFMHACEGEMVCESVNPKIPYFNAPIYLENKTPVGKVDEILGAINQVHFTIKPQEGIVATSFKAGDKFYIGGDKLLPLENLHQVHQNPREPVEQDAELRVVDEVLPEAELAEEGHQEAEVALEIVGGVVHEVEAEVVAEDSPEAHQGEDRAVDSGEGVEETKTCISLRAFGSFSVGVMYYLYADEQSYFLLVQSVFSGAWWDSPAHKSEDTAQNQLPTTDSIQSITGTGSLFQTQEL
ncbi:H/ACA snoRNP pseudouridylase subunit [Arachnomyces sp. PD_36]|nr:H/ACA snoRNP pseudouridylase subunit [Arachnomyces sp. PD_36]